MYARYADEAVEGSKTRALANGKLLYGNVREPFISGYAAVGGIIRAVVVQKPSSATNKLKNMLQKRYTNVLG